MTTDAEIQTESTEQGLTAEEGNKAIAEATIDVTDTSPEQEEKAEQQDRYDKIREKYQNDTDKIVKAYDEAQKELGRLKRETPQAPDNYEFSFEGLEGLPEDFELDSEDPLLQRMLPVFKDQKFTQDQAQELAKTFVEFQVENSIDIDAEMKELGSDAESIIERLENFGKNRLTENELPAFDSLAQTAEQAQLLHKIINMAGEQDIADAADLDEAPLKTAQEYQDEAFEYKKKHAKTISSNRGQQARYNKLMQSSMRAKEKEG